MRASTTAMLIVLTAACTGSPPPRPMTVSVAATPSASVDPVEETVFETAYDASVDVAPAPEASPAATTAGPAAEPIEMQPSDRCAKPVRKQRLLDRLAEPSLRWCARDSDCALANRDPGCGCGEYYAEPDVIAYNALLFFRRKVAVCACGRPAPSLAYVPVCRAGICRVLDRGYDEQCRPDRTYWGKL